MRTMKLLLRHAHFLILFAPLLMFCYSCDSSHALQTTSRPANVNQQRAVESYGDNRLAGAYQDYVASFEAKSSGNRVELFEHVAALLDEYRDLEPLTRDVVLHFLGCPNLTYANGSSIWFAYFYRRSDSAQWAINICIDKSENVTDFLWNERSANDYHNWRPYQCK